jgi:hypothetical protein
MATRALAAATTASVARGGAPSSSAPAARRRRDRVVRAEGERRASVAARAWGPRPRRGGGGGGGGWTTTTPKSLRNGVHHANAVVWEPVTTTTRRRATPEDDARAGPSAAAASSSSSSPPDDDDDDDEALDEALDLPVPVIVECAMLSALTSLLFHFANLLRVDAWFGALYPMPVIIAAARHGDRAGRRVMWVSTLLLFVISGVLRSTNYIFLHGAMAYALGFLWNRGKSWWWTIPIASIARCAGIFGSLTFSSLLLRENVMQLLVVQMYGLLDQARSMSHWFPYDRVGVVNADP